MHQQMINVLKSISEDPSITIYESIKGKKGFKLAQDMLNASTVVADQRWASNWSEQEKRNAIFLLIGKNQRGSEKIGFKLLVGKGENFSVIGEIYPKNKALKLWEEFIE
jgi:hypothetical protein